ncbi:acyl-CoA carboxylase subunit epsilon [Mycobacterium sp. SMC-4]|uniref:acyl-CoA carboxylase subunit epsilon n=1 Tax=Mycobacterium sp. SMC-4 TaxID=2857059 RepID=UPI003D06A504
MNHDADIVEVSDPRDMTIDDPPPPEPHFQVVKGNPSTEEVAALVAVLGCAGGTGAADPGPQELNLWGHPVDKLRYDHTSWQRVTLWERMHMRK